MKIQDFGKFSCFNQTKQLFFDDFLMIFEGFASKEKIKQNLGNHQKIIKKLSKNHQKIIKKTLFCLKNYENPRFWQVFLF